MGVRSEKTRISHRVTRKTVLNYNTTVYNVYVCMHTGKYTVITYKGLVKKLKKKINIWNENGVILLSMPKTDFLIRLQSLFDLRVKLDVRNEKKNNHISIYYNLYNNNVTMVIGLALCGTGTSINIGLMNRRNICARKRTDPSKMCNLKSVVPALVNIF